MAFVGIHSPILTISVSLLGSTGLHYRRKPKDQTFDRNIAPGARIVADNKRAAETRTINVAITKITMKSNIAITRPIPFSWQAVWVGRHTYQYLNRSAAFLGQHRASIYWLTIVHNKRKFRLVRLAEKV